MNEQIITFLTYGAWAAIIWSIACFWAVYQKFKEDLWSKALGAKPSGLKHLVVAISYHLVLVLLLSLLWVVCVG